MEKKSRKRIVYLISFISTIKCFRGIMKLRAETLDSSVYCLALAYNAQTHTTMCTSRFPPGPMRSRLYIGWRCGVILDDVTTSVTINNLSISWDSLFGVGVNREYSSCELKLLMLHCFSGSPVRYVNLVVAKSTWTHVLLGLKKNTTYEYANDM